MDKAKLNQERGDLIAQMRAVLDLASSEKRELKAEEAAEYDAREARLDEIEKHLARLANDEKRTANINEDATREPTKPEDRAVAPLASDEYRKAFEAYLRGDDVERRDLSVGTASLGGYTVPTAFNAAIVETLRQFGYIRQLAKVWNTSEGNTLQFPSATAFGTSGWGTEAGAFTESDPTFGQISLSAYKATHIAQISEELLQDTAIPIEGFLAQHLGENLALLENTAFVVGTGTGQPTGFMTNGTVGVTAGNGTSQVLTILPDTLFDVFHSLALQYRRNAVWVMNDSSIKLIRKLKDTTNQYLWQPGLAGWTPAMSSAQPDTLLGKPVYADPDVVAMAASAKSIAFGDFSRYYIRTAGGIAIQRLNELYAATGQVGFRVYERLDGKIVDTAAIKLFVNAAS